jgi:hypothetical protein
MDTRAISVEAARDDSVMELEEERANKVLHLRRCGGFEKQSASLRLPVRKEHEEVRLHPAPVIVCALVMGEAAFDAVEVAGIPGQAVRFQERQHRLGGVQLLTAIRRSTEEDLVGAVLPLLVEDAVDERSEPLNLIWKL